MSTKSSSASTSVESFESTLSVDSDESMSFIVYDMDDEWSENTLVLDYFPSFSEQNIFYKVMEYTNTFYGKNVVVKLNNFLSREEMTEYLEYAFSEEGFYYDDVYFALIKTRYKLDDEPAIDFAF